MSNSNNTVIVRADANRLIGIGHAMRCLAVSEQLISRGYDVAFAMHTVPKALKERLKRASIRVLHLSEDDSTAEAFCKLAINEGAKYAVLDGYHIGNDFERTLSATNIRRLRFDDYMPGDQWAADIIVNASPHAHEVTYAQWAPEAKLLLGARYIAFREEMISAHNELCQKKGSAKGTNGNASILINFGGSDHLDMTIRTASAIAELLPTAKIEAVTGAGYPDPERLQGLGIENLIHHHNSDNLAEIMQRARFAISAGGLTVTELALFRIPTILAITAHNQIKGAHVSWCHTILPDETEGQFNTNKMLEKILLEAKRLWHSPHERSQITGRIPPELDVLGAKRIADALSGRNV